VTIADAQATTGGIGPWTGSWNRDDVIIFGRITSPLFRVPAAGGTPAPLTELDAARQESAHFAPWFLPDGRHFLYAAVSVTNPQTRSVYVGDLSSKTRKQVLSESTATIYVSPGYLLFGRDRTLMAQPFDTNKLGTTGEAVAVAEQADVITAGVGVALGYFSASQNGVLVYTSGREPTGVQLTWFDRAGNKLDTVGQPADVPAFSLSPDGAHVAFMRRDLQAGRYELWTRDLARGTESRLTPNGTSGSAVWSADGTHIFYSSLVPGKIYQKGADGTGAEEVVDTGGKTAWDASRDGRYLVTVMATAGKNEIWLVPLFGDRKPLPFLKTEFHEMHPKLSPDGRLLAYRSDASKRNEIYVVSFPQPTAKWQISTEGGQSPVWSQDGRELYYYGPGNKVMAVEVELSVPGGKPQFGVPKPLFEVRTGLPNNNLGSFAVSRDGRFLLPVLVDRQASTPMTVVLNWPQTLKK
jgi:Tol biopolymer transport system component